jgi:hypothetical protein
VRSRVLNAAWVVLGLLIVLYPLTVGTAAPITCRGVTMRPGDRCAKADGSAVQTYEQRVATRRAAAPVLVGVGLFVAGFGTVLLVTERRRGPRVDAEPEPA